MRKTLLNRRTIILLFLSVLMVFSVGFLTYDNVQAGESQVVAKTIDEVAYTMEDGASIRMSIDNKTNGLRFAASMSVSDYEALKANTNYSGLTFGVVIAPADYVAGENKGLTEENLFGDNAIYAWDEYVNGEWVYDDQANAGKTRIINIATSKLNTNLISNKAVITASITNLQLNNIARDFVARGYIIAESENAPNDYALASYYQNDIENNVRSMAVVAEKAVADTSEYAILDVQKEWCTENYLELDGVYNDLTANPVEVNNYAENGNKIDVAALGKVNHVTDGKGNYLPFTQDGETLTLDISDFKASEELDVTVYTFNNGLYELNKVNLNVSVKTKITNATEFNAMRSATSGEYVLMSDITLTEALSQPTATFNATLDGNGKTIKGVVINGAWGIFSTIGTQAVIKNLFVENATIGGVQTGVIATFLSAGATLDNIYVSASIKSGNHSGGLVKQIYGSETLQTKVTNCVVNITDTTWVASNGLLFAFGSSTANVDLTGTYGISTVASATLVGNRTGSSYDTFRDKINALNTTENKMIYNSVADFITAIDDKTVSVKDKILCLKALGENVVTVSTLAELNAMRQDSSSGKYYILTKDIIVNGTMPAPATDFYSTFDGNGYAIIKPTFNAQYQGLFRNLRTMVKNLAIIDATVSHQTGAVCDTLRGTIDNVYVSAENISSDAATCFARSGGSGAKITNSVAYIKAISNKTVYTRTYSDGTTISGRKIAGVAYTSATSIQIENLHFITDVADLQAFALSSDVTYTTDTETEAVLKLKAMLLSCAPIKVANASSITVKDSALLSKII